MTKLSYQRPIILIGLMGCGKTTVGRELSKLLAMPFLDMDAVIEEQIGKPIRDIFRDEGEQRFRLLETALLRYLLDNMESNRAGVPIISTGGGVVLRRENRQILRQLGFCIWLNVEIPTLLARTARSANRPLLAHPNRRDILERLSCERAPLYKETAHLMLDSTHMDITGVVRRIHEAARCFFNEPLHSATE